MENQNNVSDVNTIVSRRAKREKRYKECIVEIRPQGIPTHCYWGAKTERERQQREIKEYERWAKEFLDFLRDHRSQDVQDVVVHQITEDVCSECGKNWEIYSEDGKDYCAYCRLEVASEHGG